MDRCLSITGEMTIMAASAVRDQVLAALQESSTSATLDLSQVEAIDSAGVQILLAARRTAAARELGLVVTGITPAIAEALAVYGLDAEHLSTGATA